MTGILSITKLNPYYIMKEMKTYIVGAVIGIAIYIVAKNCGFELIIVI